MPECLGVFIAVFIIIVFLCALIAVGVCVLTKKPDVGCTYDCENCPFPECTEVDKESTHIQYGEETGMGDTSDGVKYIEEE